MLELLAQPFRIDGTPVRIGASIGVAMRTSHTNSAEVLIRHADVAMYSAKAAGKHRCEVYDPLTHGALLDRMDSKATLDDVVANGELRLAYQPIVELETGDVVGVEALVRWEHPTRGLLLPGEFISLAEETGKIVRIGRWVIEAACQEIAAWRNHDPRLAALWVSVNLSSPEIHAAGLADHVRAVLKASDLPAHNLVLEVTESILVPDAESAADVLHSLKALGVRIALDDFGSGFSSLRYLDSLPFDILKIDRELVSGSGSGEHHSAVLESIITLGERLDMYVVAEGIEDHEQLHMLRALGCTAGQGYLLARPGTASTTLELVCDGRLVDELPMALRL
jgi:EAL domain-containing protein (putative c-di-GMP-specific phosphodiesterase class I)